ncbi:I78 family peptidase inhibitor [Roseisalinus antarcticus]|uniref:Peptidase inhibitor I78 family protein n=1 Tax=Roseisalinus antarcticus TaxID=254357 RepID=A0A1Y5S6V6_9RHOB|nr:I78 family peptidase inhibitor [Roseisalinus antarcticus]SLN33861.1 Peptidase inhibitor I78 family protein [Roseisalinus antarcticus]
MTHRAAAALFCAALVAGCGGLSGDLANGPSVPVGADDTCGAAPHAALVGRDATALERVLIMRQVRVIRPGDAVTMDLRPERINFDIAETGIIARIRCG